jgi:hypothetical protein
MPSTDYLFLQDHHKQGRAAKAAWSWARRIDHRELCKRARDPEEVEWLSPLNNVIPVK